MSGSRRLKAPDRLLVNKLLSQRHAKLLRPVSVKLLHSRVLVNKLFSSNKYAKLFNLVNHVLKALVPKPNNQQLLVNKIPKYEEFSQVPSKGKQPLSPGSKHHRLDSRGLSNQTK